MTISDAASKISQSLISSLPPAFLVLVVLNSLFLGLVLWFINDQISQRTQLVSKVIDRCFEMLK